MKQHIQVRAFLYCVLLLLGSAGQVRGQESVGLGGEVAIPAHLQDGEEFTTPLRHLIQYGEKLFNAKFTVQEGAGRPLSKGTGAPLSDPTSPLLFPRNFDRISAPEANAWAGGRPLTGRDDFGLVGQRFQSQSSPKIRAPKSDRVPHSRGSRGCGL